MIVVAAALIGGDGRVLVAERPAGKAHSGLWEFPGGKVEPSERLADALARELTEELGIAIAGAPLPIGFATVARDDGDLLLLLLYAVADWAGEPCAAEHRALAWHRSAALATLPMPPADRVLLPALDRYLATC